MPMPVWAHEEYVKSALATNGAGPFKGCPDFHVSYIDSRLPMLIPFNSDRFRIEAEATPIRDDLKSHCMIFSAESFGKIRLADAYITIGARSPPVLRPLHWNKPRDMEVYHIHERLPIFGAKRWLTDLKKVIEKDVKNRFQFRNAFVVIMGGARSFYDMSSSPTGYQELVKAFVGHLYDLSLYLNAPVIWAGMPNPLKPQSESEYSVHPGRLSIDIENEVAAKINRFGKVYVYDFVTLNADSPCVRRADRGHPDYPTPFEEMAAFRENHFLPHLGPALNLLALKSSSGAISS
jgi:hypothetical protein